MRKHGLLLTFGLALGIASAASAELRGVTNAGNFIDVNSANGSVSVIGSTGVSGCNSFVDFFGTLYTTTLSGRLYKVNSGTGVATLVGTINAGSGDVRGMATDTLGNCYIVTNESPTDKLWKLNLTTAVGTLVGDTGLVGAQALECDSIGQVWTYDVSDKGLCRLNRSTGAFIDVNPAVGRDASIQTLAFKNNGVLYGGQDQLFTINPTTGVSTLVGGSLTDVRGLDFNTNFMNHSVVRSGILRLGRLEAGTIGSLLEEDNDVLRVCKFIVPNQTTPPVQMELIGDAPSTQLTQYSFTMRHRMASAGPFRCQWQVFNYATNRFVDVTELPIGLSYATHTVTPSGNLDDFVSPTREIRMKYLVRPVGPTPTPIWCHEVDQVYWLLVPFIP